MQIQGRKRVLDAADLTVPTRLHELSSFLSAERR